MSMELYNSLTRSRQPLPSLPARINMYSCGVTVYDKCHIGHARSLYTFDTLVKYMRYRGYEVKFVRNITDVDDKIIAKAAQTGKTFEEVVKENIALYYKDMADLGLKPADIEPRATENIPLMIAHIEGLIAKGHAYPVGGDVYFRVRSFPTYGRLSGQSIDKMLEGVRIDKDEKKEDPLDFALWKNAKPGEPAWPSPWGDGRPGWHIECSCMSIKHLGTETLDIHAGGRDLVFPHHENEIAQAEALTGKPFARMWIHHGLLTINSQKMAKSLGNFITVQDALKKYSVSAFKLFFLSTHYASSIDYTDDKLVEMEKGIAKFKALLARAGQVPAPKLDVRLEDVDFLVDAKEKIIAAMDEDFNTALAIGHVFELVTAANRFMDVGKQDDYYEGSIHAVVKFLKDFLGVVLGLDLEDKTAGLSAEDESLVNERLEARKNKNWKRSDELRDILKTRGILVEDGKSGQTWRRS
ncbi:MAG: cysteine--tRNA ligase [Candidatus Omnitrophica bacterium]|nr:cysteine--tRNA ligase [Candidatus Omnitrophota bacterium]